MYKINNKRIRALSLAESAGCNLNCEYCSIYQTQNAASIELAKKTAQALESGEFLSNVKQALLNLEVPFSQIDQISFWGQEPTLTLHIFNKHIEDWFNTFPNVNMFTFSTNVVAHPERIIEFIKKVEEHSKLPCHLRLQLSYDGEWSTAGLRKTEPSNILKNIQYIVNECNKLMLYKTTIQFGCHGVLSRDLINSLDSFEKIKEYLIESDKDICTLAMQCMHKNITFHKNLSLGIETPIDASTEDGIKLANFITQGLYLKDSDFMSGFNTIKGFTRQFTRYQNILNACQSHNILEFLSDIAQDNINFRNYKEMHQSTFCSNNTSELKLLYDGTILNCQNYLNDTKKEYLKNTGIALKDEIRASLVSHNYFVNLLEEKDQQVINNIFYMHELAHDDSFLFMYQQTLEFMKALAEIEQINPDYLKNKEKLLLHAMIMTCAQSCGYTTYIMSGSLILRDIGAIRFFANGFLDIIEKVAKEKRY